MAEILASDQIAIGRLSVSDLSRISHVAIQLGTLCLLLLTHVTGTIASVLQTTQMMYKCRKKCKELLNSWNHAATPLPSSSFHERRSFLKEGKRDRKVLPFCRAYCAALQRTNS